MPAKITLSITGGPLEGEQFEFDEHDSLVVGRMPGCKIIIPEVDNYASRHHFLLEVNPPFATLRDLGSLNGTWVNGVKYGGREKGETPQEGAQRDYPEVDLKDGDKIRIGRTFMDVSIDVPISCVFCGEDIPDPALEQALQQDGSYICPRCQERLAEQQQSSSEPPARIHCIYCDNDVTDEAGPEVTGGYLCKNCREKVQGQVVNLNDVLQAMLREAALEKKPNLNIPNYQVVTRLGKGGQGAVFLVEHRTTGMKCAVKIMLPRAELSHKSCVLWQREIENMEILKHARIVDIYEKGVVGGVGYFLMEFCEGGSADGIARKAGGRLSLTEAGKIMLESLEGLAYIHEMEYVHRDLKPPNLLLTSPGSQGVWKIADFGLAKNYSQAGHSGITGKEYMGTPPFMPREQILNYKHFKPAGDVWAMGATFYQLLTGRFVRDFSKHKDPYTTILQEPVIPIRSVLPSLPRRVVEVIDISLSDDISNRYRDASEFKQALEEVL